MIGDPVNVAARLQGAAKPGTVIVGEVTHRLTRKAIEYVELEPLELKGKAEQVPAWEAVRAVVRGRATRGGGVDAARRPPRRARAAAGALRAGRQRGPPAPGDRDRAGGRRQDPAAARAHAERRRSRDAARRAARQLPGLRGRARLLGAGRDRPGDLRHRRRRRRRRGLAQAPPRDRGARRRTPRARSRPSGSRWRSAGRSGSSRRPTRAWTGRARGPAADARAPVLRRADADRGGEPAPAADLRRRGHPLGRRGHARPDRVPGPVGPRAGPVRVPGARRAARPPARVGRRAPERDHAHPRPARPGAAPARWSARCWARAACRRSSPVQVASRSGGNPLFAEEMVNRILEEGAGETEALPETVHSVLAARLDSLPRSERRVLQAAAVVGQTFWEGSVGRRRASRAPTCAPRSSRCARRTSSCRPPAAAWRASASTRSSTC